MNYKHFRVLLVVYALAIIGASSIPGYRFPESKLFSMDKLLHLGEYALLGFLAIRSFRRKTVPGWLVVIVAGILFSGIDEYWQSFIPGRNSDLVDMLADSSGFFLGSLFGFRLGNTGK